MTSTLTVLCPNGRRQTVKVTPNTSVLQVLEQACKKQGLKPDDYDIKHYNKALDLSLSVRFANLPNNAMLELSPIKEARQEGSVTVAVQLESGERFAEDFSPASFLWDVISKCSRNNPEDAIAGTVPVCIYMRQKFIGEELKSTTLRSIGLTGGKAIIRLIYRPVNSLSEQAHVSTPLCRPPPYKMFKADDWSESTERYPAHAVEHSWSLEETPSDACKRSSVEPAPIRTDMPTKQDEPMQCDIAMETCKDDAASSLPTVTQQDIPFTDSHTSNLPEKMDDEMDSESVKKETDEHAQESMAEIGEIKYIGPRNAVLFNLSDILNIKKDELPDEFFELTISDVRYLYNDSRRIRQELENEPLLLKQQREVRALQHLSQYGQSVIRVYFPDRLVLQGTFFVYETIQTVMDFVRSFLQNQNLDFYLYITPPKQILSPGKTLLETRLVPAAVVHFGCNIPSMHYLREDLYYQVSDPRAATQAAAEQRKVLAAESEKVSQTQLLNLLSTFEDQVESPVVAPDSAPNVSQTNSSRNRNSSSKNVPAWFKLGQK